MAERLSDAIIRRLPPPEKNSKITYDADVSGLGCRITAAGARSFVVRYRVRGSGRERTYTLGDCDNWTVGAARKEARRLKQFVDQGGDPQGDLEDLREAPTVADLCDRFVAEHLETRLRPGTAQSYKILIGRHIRPHFGKHTKVADVRFEDVDQLHRRITQSGAVYSANRSIAVLSKMFSLAIRWGMRDSNPCKEVERNVEAKRERYLDGDELVRLTTALATYPDQQVANIVRLLLLTGARSGEVFSMRWGDLDLTAGKWSKPAHVTKTKKANSVPLSAPARQLLTEIQEAQKAGKHRPLGIYVFPSHGVGGHVGTIEKAWRVICKAANINDVRPHDLRHSFASLLVSGGASLPLIGALLGHTNPTTTARYSHLFDDPLRKAVEKVGAIVGAAGKDAEGVDGVVDFPGGRRGR